MSDDRSDNVQPANISGQPGEDRPRQQPDIRVANRTSGMGDHLDESSEDKALAVARRDCPGGASKWPGRNIKELLQRRDGSPREGRLREAESAELLLSQRRQYLWGRVGQMLPGSSPAYGQWHGHKG